MASNEKGMNSKIHRFFRIIPEHGHFRIPTSFTNKYGDVIPNPIHLKTPDGREWNIIWIKHHVNFWFQKGWRDFKTHYSLAFGHLLLFEYDKETKNFGVCIFDKSTLEIKYPTQAGNDPEQTNLDREPSPLSSPQLPKNLRTEDDMRGRNESQKEELQKNKNPSFKAFMNTIDLKHYFHVLKKFAREYLKEEESNVILEVLDGRTWPCKYSHGRLNKGWRKFVLDNHLKLGDALVFELIDDCQNYTFKVEIHPVGNDETHTPPPQVRKQRVIVSPSLTTEAMNFTSENPFFRFKMARANPTVPISLNREHLEKKTQPVKLKVGEKNWEVKLLCENPLSQASSRLTKGWAKFVKENKLETGNECVFELIAKKPAVFSVHIFRCPS